ncbi:pentatricopeptide repeat-containing protein At2g37320 [Curcuma longa]|uniref:pentatricopeptide repeat-containing protein At2g37320 n=1 Tax=Curcuma longa TaxID=136217 RepID=UPI003D9DFB1C
MLVMWIQLLHISSSHSFICSKTFFIACHVLEHFSTFASPSRYRKLEDKGLHKALKILDLVIPKTSDVKGKSGHHRLINECMDDLLKVNQQNCLKFVKKSARANFCYKVEDIFEKSHHNEAFLCSRADNKVKGDALLLFCKLHNRGIKLDPSTISSAVSSCVSSGIFGTGVQLHALSIKNGCEISLSTGSSLITLYSKLGQLSNASYIFHMMPVRNVVSWTAVISGYAHYWEVETCLQLFSSMRQAFIEPNDITFVCILGSCTTSAYLGFGRSVHSLELKMGFGSYVHVSNALISMYAKCGSINEAHFVFEKMQFRDRISWNSMLSGYSQYGLADIAIDLLNQMYAQNATPDAISYLCVLSSCRHAGLVEKGRLCFDLMLKHGVNPELDHYSCIVDLLGRAGLLEEAFNVIKKMPICPNAVIWGSLLSSCRVHRNVWIGIHAAENRLLLEPGCAATYLQLANLYASVGYWNEAAKVRKLMKERGLRTSPAYAWIEIGDKVHKFKAEDGSNDQLNEILRIVDCLACHMELFECTSVENTMLEYE